MTILLKNFLFVDGTNRPITKVDVLVKNDRIAALGYFPAFKADEVIDGLGAAYLSPGFIDISGNADLYLTLFSNPSQKENLLQGATTVIGGQGGISLAPLLYGSLDLNKFWADTDKINVNWHTMKEFFTSVSDKKFGINFGTLVGHSTIRRAITGDEIRDLTSKELDVFKYILDKALKEGAFGISFNLDFPLTNLVPQKEIKPLLEIVEKRKGLFSINLRGVSDLTVYPKEAKKKFIAAVEEIINFSKETGVKTQINNFLCLKGFLKEYKTALETISENMATADVSFNFHPFELSIIPIFYFLPIWAQRGGFSDILKNLESKEIVDKIKKDLPAFEAEKIKIFNAPAHAYLAGKSLKDFCNNRNLDAKDGLIELMKLTGLRLELAYNNLSTKFFSDAITHDRSIISSSFSGFPQNHPGNSVSEFSAAFPEFLKLIINKKVIPLETAINKITGLPARQLGITDRGVIREGYFADLTTFRDSKIETVIVNGKIVVRNGEFQNNSGGRILKYLQ